MHLNNAQYLLFFKRIVLVPTIESKMEIRV